MEPKQSPAYNNLGGLLAATSDMESAVTQFEEAVRLQSDFAEAHYNLGLMLLRQGERERAEIEFRKARELNPKLEPPEY